MKLDAQRIAIGLACGWMWHGELSWPFDPMAFYWKHADGRRSYYNLPDYLNDLNAMHEAEKTLTEDQHAEFRGWLFQSRLYHLGVSATAAQRAEAFLRAIGKWEDAA